MLKQYLLLCWPKAPPSIAKAEICLQEERMDKAAQV